MAEDSSILAGAPSVRQNIAPGPSADGAPVPEHPSGDAPELAEITEHEVGEYREQDRYLPVRPILVRT